MKAEITASGTLSVTPENHTEIYAMQKWMDDPNRTTGMIISEGFSDVKFYDLTTKSDKVVDAIQEAAQHMKTGGADYLTFAEKVMEIVGIDYDSKK